MKRANEQNRRSLATREDELFNHAYGEMLDATQALDHSMEFRGFRLTTIAARAEATAEVASRLARLTRAVAEGRRALRTRRTTDKAPGTLGHGKKAAGRGGRGRGGA